MAKRGSKPCGGRRIDVEWTGCVGWDGRDRLLFSGGVGGGGRRKWMAGWD